MRDRELDRAPLDTGRSRSAEAEVDDAGTVSDRIPNRRSLVGVAERAARAAGADDEEARALDARAISEATFVPWPFGSLTSRPWVRTS